MSESMEAQVESMNRRLENFWRIHLCSLMHARGVEVYLGPDGRLLVGGKHLVPKAAELVGRFTRSIELCQFRAEVFHVFEEMARYPR